MDTKTVFYRKIHACPEIEAVVNDLISKGYTVDPDMAEQPPGQIFVQERVEALEDVPAAMSALSAKGVVEIEYSRVAGEAEFYGPFMIEGFIPTRRYLVNATKQVCKHCGQ